MDENAITFTIIFTTLILLILVIGIALSITSAHRRGLEQEKKLNLLAIAYEQELRAAQAEISEQVMDNISRELHDNIGQQLTLLYLQMQNTQLDDPAITPVLKPMEATLVQASDQLRHISHLLNTDFIEKTGLITAIRMEAARLGQLKRPAVHFHTETDAVTLDTNQQLIAFRIFQEMVNNALKHGKPKNLRIDITSTNGFTLCVHDDGQGFDCGNELKAVKGTGIQNMQRRAEMAGMQLTLTSAPGMGCTCLLQTAETH